MSNRTIARELRADVAIDMAAAGSNWMAGGGLRDIANKLYKERNLSGENLVAFAKLTKDMQESHGSSNGLVTSFCDVVSGAGVGKFAFASLPEVRAFERLERVLAGLHPHERQLLGYLITHKEKSRGTLSDYGRTQSTYGQNKTARAFAVGRVSALAHSIREQYALAES